MAINNSKPQDVVSAIASNDPTNNVVTVNRANNTSEKSTKEVITNSSKASPGDLQKAAEKIVKNPDALIIGPDEYGSTEFFVSTQGWTMGVVNEEGEDDKPGVILPTAADIRLYAHGTLTASRYDNNLLISADITMDAYTTNGDVGLKVNASAYLSIWDDQGSGTTFLGNKWEKLIRNDQIVLGSWEPKVGETTFSEWGFNKTITHRFRLPYESSVDIQPDTITLKLQLAVSVGSTDIIMIPLHTQGYVAELQFNKPGGRDK